MASAAPPKKKGNMLVICVVALVALGAGFATPMFLHLDSPSTKQHPVKEKAHAKPVTIPFGDVVVNLGEERLTRYLRVKIILVVDGENEKSVTEHINKQKAYLKSWLISYLADLSIQEVSRATGVNRLKREIRERFNELLSPEGQEIVLEVLFDEFVVQ
ncbi:MAG: flagellar basal body-associated FliL family protein [Planctomycetes bacterium]|nr:flagellar basal body-associated FliL family protein [Planctomycetota bacterium]